MRVSIGGPLRPGHGTAALLIRQDPEHPTAAGPSYGTTVTGQRAAFTSRLAIEPTNR